MTYNRDNPSPRYRELVKMYGQLHAEGDPEKGIPAERMFDGRSLPPQALRIADIIRETGAKTILDYGAGKGQQYQPQPIELPDGSSHASVAEWWGVEPVTCFDPGHEAFSTLPQGTFDGVISTDVMEHCPEEDLPWILGEIFGYARKFVYLSVAQYPAQKILPNGENAHCTLEPTEWWLERIAVAKSRKPKVDCFVCFITQETAPGGQVQSVEKFVRVNI